MAVKMEGWAYEQETRLVVVLDDIGYAPDHIALDVSHDFFEGNDGMAILAGPHTAEEDYRRRWFCEKGVRRSAYTNKVDLTKNF